MKIRFDHAYYIDEYTTFNEFLKALLIELKGKKIKKFFPCEALTWNSREFSNVVYYTPSENYLIFDDDTILSFTYNIFSMIDIKLTGMDWLRPYELDKIKNRDNFELDCYDASIVDYELNRFTDEYIIEPSADTIRPEGGDYFKEIIFHLSNGKKLCICAENAEFDGYCDIWMESNNTKGIFNGEPHKAWWND